MSGALQEALTATARGWHVFPLRPRSKAPATERGWHDATADPGRVREWTWPGVGVACEPSGLLVVDVDPRHGGDDELHQLEHRLGPLPRTVECLTGGGGRHIYFTLPAFETRAELAPGVELKRRGYVVAPPSVHPDTGRAYTWGEHPDEQVVAGLPPAWLDAVQTRPPAASSTRRAARGDDALARIPATVYVPSLTGRPLDRRGYARCPFHGGGQERTPSLRAWADPERGWHCFGCNRGGSIYQLAALLRSDPLPLRGAAFLAVQDALLDHFTTYYQQRTAA